MALKIDISDEAKDIGDAFVVLLTQKHTKVLQPTREQWERLHKGIQLDLDAGRSFRENEMQAMLAGFGDNSRPGWRRIQNGLNRILAHGLSDSPPPVPAQNAHPASIVVATTTAEPEKPSDSVPPRLRSVTTLTRANDQVILITPYLVYHETTGRYEQVGPLPKKQGKDSDD
jgi:hypothetical protein